MMMMMMVASMMTVCDGKESERDPGDDKSVERWFA